MGPGTATDTAGGEGCVPTGREGSDGRGRRSIRYRAPQLIFSDIEHQYTGRIRSTRGMSR